MKKAVSDLLKQCQASDTNVHCVLIESLNKK